MLVVDPAPRGGLVHHSFVVCSALARDVPTTLLAVAPYELDDVPRSFPVVARLRAWPKRSGPGLLQRLMSALASLAVALRNWIVVFSECRRLRPDVVHFQNVPTNHPSGQWWRWPYLDVLMLSIVRRLGAAVVTMIHDVPLGPRAAGTAVLMRASDGILSHRSLDRVERGTPTNVPVLVVPHPPYGFIARLAAPDRSSILARCDADARLVVHPGYIETYKGTDTLIQAFAEIADRFPDAVLVVAGAESEPAFGRRCRDLIERSGLGDRVLYEPRFVDLAELGALLCAATVVALPYRPVHKSAASGMVYAALGAGARLVVSSDGSFDDVLDQPALDVIPADDVPALASAIERALLAGRPLSSPDGDWSGAVDDLLKLYSAAIDARRVRIRT